MLPWPSASMKRSARPRTVQVVSCETRNREERLASCPHIDQSTVKASLKRKLYFQCGCCPCLSSAPSAEKRKDLIRNWTIAYIGNICGCLLIDALRTRVDLWLLKIQSGWRAEPVEFGKSCVFSSPQTLSNPSPLVCCSNL